MRSRAERRHLSEKVKKRRNKHYERLVGREPRNPGQSRAKSPLDCGQPGCPTCAKDPKPDPIGEPEDPTKRCWRCRMLGQPCFEDWCEGADIEEWYEESLWELTLMDGLDGR